MNSKTNYIIGATGFIGKYIYRTSKNRKYDTIGTYCSHYAPNYSMFDLTKNTLEESFGERINGSNLILCSAKASIDDCKRNIYDSQRLNVDFTKKIILEAIEHEMKLVFISSEAVFDGKKGLYSENDETNPITVYGRQKEDVENFILEKCKNALIFRVSRATGVIPKQRDILNEVYNRLISNKAVLCIKGQIFSLTYVQDIADAILLSVMQNKSGLYHLSNGEIISRYDLALEIANNIGANSNLVCEKDLSEFEFVDGRHLNGGLEGTKFENEMKFRFKDTNWIIQEFIRNVKELRE